MKIDKMTIRSSAKCMEEVHGTWPLSLWLCMHAHTLSFTLQSVYYYYLLRLIGIISFLMSDYYSSYKLDRLVSLPCTDVVIAAIADKIGIKCNSPITMCPNRSSLFSPASVSQVVIKIKLLEKFLSRSSDFGHHWCCKLLTNTNGHYASWKTLKKNLNDLHEKIFRRFFWVCLHNTRFYVFVAEKLDKDCMNLDKGVRSY